MFYSSAFSVYRMIILPFQILCNSGWKDIEALQQEDKPAMVNLHQNTFSYQRHAGLFVVPNMFRLSRCERSRYSQLFLSEPTTVINQYPSSASTSGTIAPRFSEQFFDQVNTAQAMEVLREYVRLDNNNNGCLRNVDYAMTDHLMQLSIHCGIPAQIAFQESVLDLPTMYFGYNLPVKLDVGDFPTTALLGAMLTMPGAIIIRTLHKNHYTMFVVTTV